MMQTVLTQIQLPLVLVSLSLYVIHAHDSPLSDSNSSACPPGWYQYEQFCVTRGQGSTDKEVALYCDRFGGIGIKGLCIIKRHNLESPSALDLRSDFSSESDEILPSYRDLEPRDSASSLSTDIFGNSLDSGQSACLRGWTHYSNLCVYKPWSVLSTCSVMDAVEIHGLCVKHADVKAIANRDVGGISRKEKRICCCANFKARGNKYGC